MKNLLSFALLHFLAVSLFADGQYLAFNESSANQMEISSDDNGEYSIKTLEGGDPHIYANCNKSDLSVFEFEYFCPQGIEAFQLFYGPPIYEKASIVRNISKAEGWQKISFNIGEASNGFWSGEELRLDFGNAPDVRIKIREMKLREPSVTEKLSADAKRKIFDQRVLNGKVCEEYFKKSFAAKIISVKVLPDEIEIYFDCPDLPGEDLKLGTLGIWQDSWKGLTPKTAETAQLTAANEKKFTLPRFAEDGSDLMYNKWALFEKNGGRQISHYAYADDFSAICREMPPRITPAGKKGMSCVGFEFKPIWDEMTELGVKHIDMNVFFSALLAGPDSDDFIETTFNGRTVRLNASAVKDCDDMALFCMDNGILLSAIILVCFDTPESYKKIIHPDAEDSGLYPMVNMSEREGFEIYAAILNFLADRYGRSDLKYGRIDNWIMHNEVDQQQIWTNMGEQAMSVYVDQLARSMRTMEIAARSRNPEGKVFISLTHDWMPAHENNMLAYEPRNMIDFLATLGEKEGDFNWGVAYHPYPENLFRADMWNDKLPTDDFDTRVITPRNIHVLSDYLAQEKFLKGGKPRTILLSEQGFHSEYTDEGFELQSQAFIYTWRHIRDIPSIEAFHNHRWIDDPGEGGLRLGLRTPVENGKPYGDKKPAWETYKKLETPAEKELFRQNEKYVKKHKRLN